MNKALERYNKRTEKWPPEWPRTYHNQVIKFAEELDRREFTVRRIVPTTGRIMTALPDISTEAIWVRISFMCSEYKIIEVRLYDNSMSFVLG